jgi:hypothetical protein
MNIKLNDKVRVKWNRELWDAMETDLQSDWNDHSLTQKHFDAITDALGKDDIVWVVIHVDEDCAHLALARNKKFHLPGMIDFEDIVPL